MLKITFDDQKVYVSYDDGEWLVSNLNNQWLWLVGCLEAGEKIKITDDRTELQEHQHNMSFTLENYKNTLTSL